jgi:tetratricopeptide (TPR) repeat protein
MRKVLIIGAAMLCVALSAVNVMAQGAAVAVEPSYNFGDFRSSTLTTKAWGSLNSKDLNGVLAYTNKCLELYAENARVMQAELKDFPAGDDQKIFSLWALNDVATSLYIQGEAYRQAGKIEDAKKAFGRVVAEFSFGQAYDPANKSFWKPVVASKEKLLMIEKGLDLEFGDMSSSFLIKQAWGGLAAKNLEVTKAYVDKAVELYGETGKSMQATMKEYAWESKEKIFSFWALNDVGTGLFILAEAYRLADKKAEAIATYQKLVNEYFYAQCWDAQGWFWKPAEAAQQKLVELEVASGK